MIDRAREVGPSSLRGDQREQPLAGLGRILEEFRQELKKIEQTEPDKRIPAPEGATGEAVRRAPSCSAPRSMAARARPQAKSASWPASTSWWLVGTRGLLVVLGFVG